MLEWPQRQAPRWQQKAWHERQAPDATALSKVQQQRRQLQESESESEERAAAAKPAIHIAHRRSFDRSRKSQWRRKKKSHQ